MVVVAVVVWWWLFEPRGIEAKDCMESNKGAAGSGIKDEMGEQGLDLSVARPASHQTGNDRWSAAEQVEMSLGIRSSRRAHLRPTCKCGSEVWRTSVVSQTGRKANLTGGQVRSTSVCRQVEIWRREQ